MILYCAGGARSVLAADALQKMGYKKVSSLEGGMKAWKDNGCPVQPNMQVYSTLNKEY